MFTIPESYYSQAVKPRGETVNERLNFLLNWYVNTGTKTAKDATWDIQIEMNVLEKDLPYVGKAIWGDAPVQIIDPADIGETGPRTEFYGDKVQDDASRNNFSKNIRYDINRVDQTNIAATP